MNLPTFKYHPNPIATGALEASAAVCQCCDQARGYIYTGNVYSTHDVEHVCPWCIADGKVYLKFQGELSDAHALAGLSQEIIDEVTQKTPGYISWQQDSWLSCCNDACEFHGDATLDELLNLTKVELQQLSKDSGFSVDDLPEMIECYEPKGSPAFYKFVCRHCKKVRFNADCD